MSDNPTCPQFPARPPHGGGEPFIAPPAPCRKPGLSVLSVNGRTPDRNGDLALAYIDGAEYDAGYGDPPRPALLFRQGDEVVAVVDATPLLKDGMVSSVEVSGGKLVVTFNTDAGKEPVEVPLTDIFDPASYYDKAAADGRFALKGEMSVAAGTGADADKTTITLMPGVLATVLSAHQPLDAYFNAAEYDSAGRKILLKHGSVVKAQIDATAFIKDGMVSSVAISSGKLVITFNTDAGLEPIEIPLTDIFNPANYYDKTAADAAFVAKVDGKGLSTEDFTAEEKQKLAGIAEGADVTPAPIAPSQSPANPDEEGKAADAYWTGWALSAKAEARSGTQGNIAVYAEYGTLLEDSGYKPSDFATHDDVAFVAGNVDTAQATADYAQRSADDAFTKADEALSTANNKADDNAVVKLTGDQSIGGAKTFTDSAYFNMGLAAPSTLLVYGQDSSARFEVDDGRTGDYVRFGVGDYGVGIGFEYTKNGSSYRVDLPERDGVLSVKADVDAAATAATNYTDAAIGAAIANTNPTFSNAVLAVGLNIDTNSVAVLNDIAATFGGFPIEGTATAVGGLLAALAAAIAWLKKNKVGSFASVGGATATVENSVAKLDDFFTESNSYTGDLPTPTGKLKNTKLDQAVQIVLNEKGGDDEKTQAVFSTFARMDDFATDSDESDSFDIAITKLSQLIGEDVTA